MFFKYYICKHEIGLCYHKGELVHILTPGEHRIFTFGDRHVEIYNRMKSQFSHDLLDLLVHDKNLSEHLVRVDLKDNERAFVWRDGRLEWMLEPGLHAFWKEPHQIKVETFSIGEEPFEHPRFKTILNHAGVSQTFETVRVDAGQKALIFLDGVLQAVRGPGFYAYWRGVAKLAWQVVDTREATLDVTGQEIMSADKVTLRLNLLVNYQVTDVERSALEVNDYVQALYREAQLALRAAVGTRTLDRLLSDKESVGQEVRQAIATRAEGFGVQVHTVGVRDIILPGEMKTLLNQVTEAQKAAEANLIRRREETAAARSQANTAKLLSENPTLVRMKELEAIQEILADADVSFHFGQGDLRTQMRELVLGAE